MLKGLFVLPPYFYERIYSPQVRDEIGKLVHIYAPCQSAEDIREHTDLLQDADVIFSGWGAPKLDESFMRAAANLKAFFYGAGSIKGIVTDIFWRRNIPITSAYAANAVPVAEYALSQILFLLKGGWYFSRKAHSDGKYPPKGPVMDHLPGAYGSTVGIIALGLVGRLVCEHLRRFDVHVIAYDPYVSKSEADALNVELCDLDEIFTRANVVSLHAPHLESTQGMVCGRHFASMKPWAGFVNTSRGAVVREPEMIEVLRQRPDLHAVLDVTFPEPPEPGSPLYALPNVALTPHIAGSDGQECYRMGAYMLEELRRFCKGEALRWAISEERSKIMA